MSYLENGCTGHRGDAQHHPENTIEAFEGAMRLGCDWVETDLHLTRDGRIVLCHNADTEFYAEKRLRIAETDYAELRALNMATAYNLSHEDQPPRLATIPSLEEALELFRGQERTRLSLQPKAVGTLEAAEKIIREMKVPEELLGFNDGSLAFMTEARHRFPAAEIFYDLCDASRLEADLYAARVNRFQSIVMEEHSLTAGIVRRIREEGFWPGAWNVDNPGELDRFLAMGVHRFYTDIPAVLLQKLSTRR